ncbi:MAG TPA: hypothetical protein VJU87_01330 [Gemmatimonadaceae bacterium]|nr:hypothetical protein [Gemmatimonadaceae bacterium]
MRSCIVLALLLCACTRTNVALLDQSVHLQRTCEEGILMYTSPEKAPQGYKELALLNSTGNTQWTSEAGMMKSMRQKAAEIGATGIILGGISEPGAGTKVAGAVLGTGAERKGKSLAIFATEDSAKVNAACRSRQ